jgi:hypothetical protein
MTTNGTITKQQVAGATADAVSRLPAEVQEVFHIQVDHEGIYRSDGGWIIPVDIDASPSRMTAYDLDRALSQVQEQVEEQLKTDATVVLQP